MRRKRRGSKLLENQMDSNESISDFSSGVANLCKSINSKISEEGSGAFILGAGEAPTEIPFFIPTGSTILDTIIANKPNGGIPLRRVTEIFGEPSTGKSLLANHILANAQKLGGLAVLIDTEMATSPEFLKAIGVDLKELIWVQVPTVEKCFATIEAVIQETEKMNPKPKFVCIVWDSIAGTSDEVEMEGDYEAAGYGMAKAKMLSKGFRKITQYLASKDIALVCTNQIRSKMGVVYGEKTDTPGGWALKFYTSLRIQVKRNGYLKEKIEKNDKTFEETRGVSAKCVIKKSRVGPPFRECSFNIYFNKGIDDRDSWFDALLSRDAIERPSNVRYVLNLPNREPIEFKKAEWKNILKDKELEKELKEYVIKSHIIDFSSFDDDDEEQEEEVVETTVSDSMPEEQEKDVYIDSENQED